MEREIKLQQYLDKQTLEANEFFQDLESFFTSTHGFSCIYRDGAPCFIKGTLQLYLPLFRDHANLYLRNAGSLELFIPEYKLTPKGMIQIGFYQKIPYDLLSRFIEINTNAF